MIMMMIMMVIMMMMLTIIITMTIKIIMRGKTREKDNDDDDDNDKSIVKRLVLTNNCNAYLFLFFCRITSKVPMVKAKETSAPDDQNSQDNDKKTS